MQHLFKLLSTLTFWEGINILGITTRLRSEQSQKTKKPELPELGPILEDQAHFSYSVFKNLEQEIEESQELEYEEKIIEESIRSLGAHRAGQNTVNEDSPNSKKIASTI